MNNINWYTIIFYMLMGVLGALLNEAGIKVSETPGMFFALFVVANLACAFYHKSEEKDKIK